MDGLSRFLNSSRVFVFFIIPSARMVPRAPLKRISEYEGRLIQKACVPGVMGHLLSTSERITQNLQLAAVLGIDGPRLVQTQHLPGRGVELVVLELGCEERRVKGQLDLGRVRHELHRLSGEGAAFLRHAVLCFGKVHRYLNIDSCCERNGRAGFIAERVI